jgi:hypothetical protein
MSIELAYKPDAAEAARRMEAWWNRAILDRPCIQVTAPRPNPVPIPQKEHSSLRERWLDAEYAVDCAQAYIANTYYGGEILPAYFPNLGPELLTATLGAELEFTRETSWSIPILHNWDDVPSLRVDPENLYTRTLLEMTRLGLEKGRGKFLTGITDLHPGGDLAASLREPQQLALDLVESPDQVKRLMEQLRSTFYTLYSLQHDLMLAAGQTITTSWLPLFSEGRYYIPSNDFSCMVSAAMFREFFLQEIIEEVEWLDRSIYHLDGPGALQHLDALLEIEKLDAVQFVYGAGNEPASRWMPVYQRVQKAGKNLHISIDAAELDIFMQSLHPEGVMLQMGAPSPEAADALIARASKWTRAGKF